MLVEIFHEEGFKKVSGYDPFYKNDKKLLLEKYDFITMCEVIEHVSSIADTLKELSKMLYSGGWLVISTCMKQESTNFNSWYYILDDTHINFLTLGSVEWITKNYPFQIEAVEKDLIILSKK